MCLDNIFKLEYVHKMHVYINTRILTKCLGIFFSIGIWHQPHHMLGPHCDSGWSDLGMGRDRRTHTVGLKLTTALWMEGVWA